jgi:TRAP transporter TAXI family solute receptor
MLPKTVRALTVLATIAGLSLPAQADVASDNRSKVNQHVVGIMAGRPGSTDLDLAYDLDITMSDGYELRVVPMVSQGSAKEFEDLLYLRGVDMAVVQHDVAEFIEQNNIYPGIKNAVRLISPLGEEQFHVLARGDIQSIYDLAGQKVNFGRSESGTSMTAGVVFGALGIAVDVTTVDHKIALEQLRNGEIAALCRTSGAPNSLFEEIAADENLHLLPVPATGQLASVYKSAALTSEHYPALVPPGQSVDTVGVGTVLISYNWPKGHPRGETVAAFTKRFFTNYDKLLEPGLHESWREIDISEEVPGLQRHWAAEEALKLIKDGRSS